MVPEISTVLPGPNAKAVIDRDAVFVSPSYTRPYPLVVARGQGAVIEDVDGNRFLDCAAGIAVATTGHSHPDVRPAIVAIAKGIASGMPLGVSAARADVMVWPPGSHASTFGGNPVS